MDRQEVTSTATGRMRDLGSFIRSHRESAQLSLRSAAAQAGISNPYLSQIERGLRKPSAEILQRVAVALRISAETLYVQAGILEDPSQRRGNDLSDRIRSEPSLTAAQRRALLEVYHSFRRSTVDPQSSTPTTAVTGSAAGQQYAAAKQPAARTRPAASSSAEADTVDAFEAVAES